MGFEKVKSLCKLMEKSLCVQRRYTYKAVVLSTRIVVDIASCQWGYYTKVIEGKKNITKPSERN